MRASVVLLAAGIASAAYGSELPRFRIPVDCELWQSCVIQNFVDADPSAGAKDYACGSQTYDGHDGTDIRIRSVRVMRAGVAVIAAASGRVVRVRDGMADSSGRTDDPSIRGRECGNGVVVDHGGGWESQYCHMAKGSISVKPGDSLTAGDRLGQIGMSGKSEFPHLHFAVRKDGKVIDPFAFGAEAGACSTGFSLWDASLGEKVSYRAGFVFDAGFSGSPVTKEAIDLGEPEPAAIAPTAAALVAYVRVIGLRAGDVQRLTIRDPSGAVFVDSVGKPLDGNKAEYFMFAGRKRSAERWPPGTYRARYTVQRNGAVVIERSFESAL